LGAGEEFAGAGVRAHKKFTAECAENAELKLQLQIPGRFAPRHDNKKGCGPPDDNKKALKMTI
jgi:hypothetical protein